MSRAEREPPNLREAAQRLIDHDDMHDLGGGPADRLRELLGDLRAALEEHDTTAYVVDLNDAVPPRASHVVVPVEVLEKLRGSKE